MQWIKEAFGHASGGRSFNSLVFCLKVLDPSSSSLKGSSDPLVLQTSYRSELLDYYFELKEHIDQRNIDHAASPHLIPRTIRVHNLIRSNNAWARGRRGKPPTPAMWRNSQTQHPHLSQAKSPGRRQSEPGSSSQEVAAADSAEATEGSWFRASGDLGWG